MVCLKHASLVLLLVSVSTATFAQESSAIDTARSFVEKGDTVRAINYLEEAVRKSPRNAELWHELGMLGWAYTKNAKSGIIMDPRMARIRIVADSALRRGAQLAGDNEQYWYDLGKFALATGNTFVRAGANGFFDRSMEAAAKNGNDIVLSRSLDERGMHEWRAYEAVAHRVLVGIPPDVSPNFSPVMGGNVSESVSLPSSVRRDKWGSYFREIFQKLSPPPGRTNYTFARNAFDSARTIDPLNTSAARHYFMTLVERREWAELRQSAGVVISQFPDSAFGWLTIAVAELRMGDAASADRSFQRALGLMSPEEESHYQAFERLLAPRTFNKSDVTPDSVQFAKASKEQREKWERQFWFSSDPRSSTSYNEVLLEFQARIVEADLLWSSDDLSLRGSTSDRGNVYVRYGPPDEVYNVHPQRESDEHRLVWVYPTLSFVFRFTPYFGVAHNSRQDLVAKDSQHTELPVSWDNVKEVARSVPMFTRVARFRATSDSSDLVIAAALPTLALFHNTEFGGQLPIDVFLDVQDSDARTVVSDRQRTTVQGENLPSHINAWWSRRVGGSLSRVRVNAEQPDVERIAVGREDVRNESLAGFAMSDVLFTAPSPTAARALARWTDVSIKPTVGFFDVDQPVGLLWETYGLNAHDGDAKYRVTIGVERLFKNNLRGIGARIVANVTNVLQGNPNGNNSLTVTYDQLRQHSDALLDQVTIGLNQTAPGNYRLNIKVDDLISGKSVSRQTEFTLLAKETEKKKN